MNIKLVLVFLITLYPAVAFSWCESYPDVKKEFYSNKYVFSGKVVSEIKANQSGDYFDGIYYDIDIEQIFKGESIKNITVFSENSSGRFPMDVGQRYLVFTSVQKQEWVDDTYAISNCGNSGVLIEKTKELSAVKLLTKNNKQSSKNK